MDTRILEIKNKLNQLKELDKRFSVFGAARHKYSFNPVLTEHEITAIENRNSITLNSDYKLLLMNLGNGGAGCGYGLEVLSLKHIDKPYIGSDELLKNWKDDINRIDMNMIDVDRISGYIKLFDSGCGMETSLIVKGKDLGNLIWYDCDGRFYKIDKNCIELYIDWLDESLEIMHRVKDKMLKLPILEVIKDEWDKKNFSIRQMVYSIADISQPGHSPHTSAYKIELIRTIDTWRERL